MRCTPVAYSETHIPSRLTGLVPALRIYPLASLDWSPPCAYTLSPHWIGPRPAYIPSRLTGLVPALRIYTLVSPGWSPPCVYTLSPHRIGPRP
eukprot:2180712-Pyramimonas_sp.AAC.1